MRKSVLIITVFLTLMLCACNENKPDVSDDNQSVSSTESFSSESSDDINKKETSSYDISESNTDTINTDTSDSSADVVQTKPATTSTKENQTSTFISPSNKSVTTATIQNTQTLQAVENFSSQMENDDEKPFETDDNGAVILDVETDTSEEDLIKAGQEIYINACETNFRYHVGCPYNVDYSDSVENKYGWKYYLVTDSGYTTISDIEKDYYKIFAEEYGNDLSELYIEQDGKLYAFDGARDKNVFYEKSEVTGIIEQTEDKIVFNVENYYTGNDMSPDTPVTETEQFTVVIHNGEWRIGDFYLPY
ncbi:MAG: hypothetical protein K2G63_04575 [Oscillospiraceae bacterium]|nr:hypothetical protein [Oscillospiraceae bacterium]